MMWGWTITGDKPTKDGEIVFYAGGIRCMPWRIQRHADMWRACGWQHVRVGWRFW